MKPSEIFIEKRLAERRLAGTYRSLKPQSTLIDFCSNDYLGFARSAELKRLIDEEVANIGITSNGSTGSRLLTGNSAYAQELEKFIAGVHGCEAGLIFNSGYDANLGLFSSLPQRGDTIITDELIHASIIDGVRLSFANRYIFKHNDLESLEQKLKLASGNCYVAIESVYSMDGDSPPLQAIAELAHAYNASLIVDEAHAVGLYGFGLVNGALKDQVFARIVTFGKALGCHGAVVLGSDLLAAYLMNFARSFIYTTAPSLNQLASIKTSYNFLLKDQKEKELLKNNIFIFKKNLNAKCGRLLIKSESAVQCLVLNSSEQAKMVAGHLQNSGLDVRAILSPTVPAGSERIRICLHSFNTLADIALLTDTLNQLINAL